MSKLFRWLRKPVQNPEPQVPAPRPDLFAIPAAYEAPNSRLYHYDCSGFDPVGLISAFVREDLQPHPDYVTNFIGLLTPVEVHPSFLETQKGAVEGPPQPGTWHADIAEWASVFHAVTQASDEFSIIELGCGWGCWLSNAGLAARSLGKSVRLIGVEGDANHLKNARKTLDINGFNETDFTLHHGIAGPASGKAIFPLTSAEEANWGGSAVFGATEAQLADARNNENLQVLDTYTLKDLAKGRPVDLLHIDIQGAEHAFAEGNFDDISRYAKRVFIGTHSRVLEGKLMTLFLEQGWHLEMERTAYARIVNGKPHIVIDGVQLWKNPAL